MWVKPFLEKLHEIFTYAELKYTWNFISSNLEEHKRAEVYYHIGEGWLWQGSSNFGFAISEMRDQKSMANLNMEMVDKPRHKEVFSEPELICWA